MSYGVVPPGLANSRVNRPSPLEVEADDEAQSLLRTPVSGGGSGGGAPSSRRATRAAAFAAGGGSGLDGYARFEGLDFEETENTVYRSDQASQGAIDSLEYSAAKWAVCLMIGAATAMAAFAVNLGVENISGLKFWVTLTMLERGWTVASLVVYAAMNLVLVLSSIYITITYAPAAAGSGIADVKAFLNGIDVPGIFFVRTLAVKLVGALFSVSGGLAIGKEGPFVHIGAATAAIVSQGGEGGVQLPFFRRFWNDRDRCDFVACGAAAGVAAAFRSPVGGVLFALEEMTSWWSNRLLWLAFFTTAIVSVGVRVFMKLCVGSRCGFFGSGGFIIFEIAEGQDNYELYEMLPMLLLGVVGGLLGSAFNYLSVSLAAWKRLRLDALGPRGRLYEGALVSLVSSLVTFIIPLLFACAPCPPDAGDACPRRDNSHSGNFVGFACPAGSHSYNDIATIFFNTQDDAIRNLFASKTKREYSVEALITFTACFYLLAVIASGLACPVGLFVPSILCGAAYGRLVGIFVADMRPSSYIDEGTYALLGAASFLGGAMRMTVCICVMLLELTNNLALLPLIMLVLLIAKAVGDGTGVLSIYELQMGMKQLPYLDPAPEGYMRHMTAKECCGRPPVTLQRIEKVRNIVAKLRATNHNVYPVVQQRDDGSNYVVGTLLRQHLLLLLQTRKCLQPAPYIAEVSSRVAFSYSTPDFSKPISSAPLTLDDLKLSDEHYDLYLDLGPYANPTYHVVQEDTSLAKVYTLFRTLGLRHVAVVPRSSQIVGIISRKDLLPHVLESKFDDGYEQQQDGGARADGLPGGLMAGNGGSLGHHAAPGGLDHHAAGGGGGGMLTPTAGQRRSDPRF